MKGAEYAMDGGEEQEEDVDEVAEHYQSMDDDKFFDTLTEEVADSSGIAAEELEEMPIHEFEERSNIEVKKPYHPRGSREGYKDTDRLEVIDKDDYRSRRKRILAKLGIE